ncbi:hypothetical protein [Luteolibacter sp. Populi]|uniref:hypothetical protein n=1 Tax=Luteolibacter sp. Populi TaxID=3230487 RepID=UPI0034651B20
MSAHDQITEASIGRLMLEPRKCDAAWLINRANQVAEIASVTESANLLVVSCVETRNAIEQLWFEIYVLLKGGALAEGEFEKCRRQSDGFLKAIKTVTPSYRKLVYFSAICCELSPGTPRTIPWDLKILKRTWSEVSNYCHAQASPDSRLRTPSGFQKE